MAARFTFTVSATDIGRRIMVRYRRPEGGFSDVIGILEAWDAGMLTIRRRDGECAQVPETLLVAGKPVPPPPQRRAPRRAQP